MWLDSIEVKSNTFNWHKWSQIHKCMYKDCFSHQWTEASLGSKSQSLFHQFSGCVASLISIAQPWHMKWSGESGPRHGGCTVSSLSCFGVRSVKGTMCSPHKHPCKVGAVTTGCISSPLVCHIRASHIHFVKGTAQERIGHLVRNCNQRGAGGWI